MSQYQFRGVPCWWHTTGLRKSRIGLAKSKASLGC